ncbi:hypothetical protein ABMA57_09225 [Saccharospirillum sp. HFRX-1]|uniref:hypothetical protein n=1 Tax=unclassified Saccharospirillum TaxID=2633430 RepID=UPI0037172A56
MRKVFIVSCHVKGLENSIMPKEVEGAYVSCYSQGIDYDMAVKNILEKLANDGLYLEEILEPLHEMDVASWDEHINEMWPDHINSLPSQSEFSQAIADNKVIYGPFGTYGS